MGFFAITSEREVAGIRLLIPYTLMLLLFILNIVSFSFSLTGTIKAPLFLMAVYYWSIHRPTLIPAWLMFTAGVLVDFMTGLPPGLNALTFVTVQWFVSDQRRFLMGQPFFMIWTGFLIVDAASMFMQWCIFAIVNGYWPPIQPLGFSILLGAALFPAICILLRLSHKALPETGAAFIYKAKSRIP